MRKYNWMEQPSRKQKWLLSCAGVSAFLLVAGISYANFGSTNGAWLTNNDNLWVGRRGLTTTYANGVKDALANSFEPIPGWSTTTEIASTCDDYRYDICVYDANYGNNGMNGWTECAGSISGSHPSKQCSVVYVRINTYYSPAAERIACHEIGHAVGLQHTSSSSSCMKTGGTASGLSTHDKQHLDDNY